MRQSCGIKACRRRSWCSRFVLDFVDCDHEFDTFASWWRDYPTGAATFPKTNHHPTPRWGASGIPMRKDASNGRRQPESRQAPRRKSDRRLHQTCARSTAQSSRRVITERGRGDRGSIRGIRSENAKPRHRGQPATGQISSRSREDPISLGAGLLFGDL